MIKITSLKYRNYCCLNCGHVQKIQTNHMAPCIDYCKNCSWKPSFGNGRQISFNGRTYRDFIYSPIKRKRKKDYCPNCDSVKIYYPEMGTPNDDVIQCGGCGKLIEKSKLIKK